MNLARTLVPVVTLGLFSTLASFSCGRFCPTDHHVGSAKISRHAQSRPVHVWRDENAAKLLTAEDFNPAFLKGSPQVKLKDDGSSAANPAPPNGAVAVNHDGGFAPKAPLRADQGAAR